MREIAHDIALDIQIPDEFPETVAEARVLLEGYAATGRYELIVVLGDELSATVEDVADDFPAQRFALVGGQADGWMDGENPNALGTLGDVFYARGEYGRSLLYYDKAVGIQFNDPELWIKKGDAHKMLKSYKESADAYQKAINADPEYTSAWVKCGAIYLLMNDKGTALEFFNTALALDPNNGEVAHQRGLVYFTMDRLEEALNDFDLAFSVEPADGNHLVVVIEAWFYHTKNNHCWMVYSCQLHHARSRWNSKAWQEHVAIWNSDHFILNKKCLPI